MKASYLDILVIAIFLITLVIAYFKKFNKNTLLSDFMFGARVILSFVSIYITYYLARNIQTIEKGISILISELERYIVSPVVTTYIVTVAYYAIFSYIIYQILNSFLGGFRRIFIDSWISRVEAHKSMNGSKISGITGIILNITTAFAYASIILIIAVILSSQKIINIEGQSIFVPKSLESFVQGDDTVSPFSLTKNKVNDYGVVTENGESGSNNKQNVIVYYNGVTLPQAVKSDSQINATAREVTKGAKNDLEKARDIYNWIEANISYDNNKADEITENDGKGMKSGAIEAFNNKSGVCFDFASLYVAMARAVGLQVRIVSGEGYTGTEWGPHAWNEVYIPSEKKWIPVDPTFASSGDYFDNADFDQTHRDAKVIGQW